MLTFILEAAFRSAIMAAAVWMGIRIFRVHNLLAQKIAWAFVLLGALAIPMVMRAPFLSATRRIQIPISGIPVMKFEDHIREPLTMNPPLGLRLANGLTLLSSGHGADIEVSGIPIPKADAAALLNQPDKYDPRIIEAHESRASLQAFDPTPSSNLTPSRTWKSESSFGTHSTYPPNLTALPVRLLFYFAYLSIAGILVIRTIVALGFAVRIWRRSFPVSTTELGLSLAQLDTSTPLHIRVSPDLNSPATIGSTVLLPADYTDWDEAKLLIVLAHEQSHVHQKDFYLQLAAVIHASIFWFSPLGWWLKSKLSDLGEALSDHAGLAHADSPYSYAQILLEFAATPHKPFAGVAMARSSNLSTRIDRIVDNQSSRLAFLGSRRHVLIAGVLAPLALIAAVCLIRIVPAVEAAQSKSAVNIQSSTQSTVATQNSENSTSGSGASSTSRTGQFSTSSSDQVTSTDSVESSDAVLPQTPSVPPAPAAAPEPSDASDIQVPEPPSPPEHEHGFGVTYSLDDSGQHSFAIVGDKDSTVTMNGHYSKEFDEARAKYHHNFIWFEHNGKSYVITDPAIVAQSASMFQTDPRLKLRQEELQRMQFKLDQEMKNLKPEIDKASQPGPEFQAQMAKLNAELAQLQTQKFKHIDEQIAQAMKESDKADQKQIQKQVQEITQEKLGELSEKMGEIQGEIGEIQGKIGERQGLIGEKQGEIGERMGKVGEEMGRIGEEQGRKAEEASRKMQSVLDQAVKDGKAKPVN